MRNSRTMYIAGYVISVILTLGAYVLVSTHVAHHHLYPSDTFMKYSLFGLAVLQLFAQMVLFLGLGREKKPHWNTYAFIFAGTIVLIIVIGSLWIMSNLNYRMMYSPEQINRYLHSEGDL
jgi:cytochrome o ubiquinol oxidase operon protein cyoD